MATTTPDRKHTMQSRVALVCWRLHSRTRDGVWHLVSLEPNGYLGCSCEWWQNGGGALKDCAHVADVRGRAVDLPRCTVVWTDDEMAPTLAEWVPIVKAVSPTHGPAAGICPRCGEAGHNAGACEVS